MVRRAAGAARCPRRVQRVRSSSVGIALVVGCLLALGGVAPTAAKVFTSQNQALEDAFPDATRIDRETRILRAEEVERIEELARADLDSKLVVLHTAYRNEALLGYAHIDVHNVRTQPEAFMIVLTPAGVVRSVRVLAFHEPLDYLPTERWYAQFEGVTDEDPLRVGSDVHGVVGATLSARAAANGVRRMLAYWEVLLRPNQSDPAAEGSLPAEGSSGAEGSIGAEGSTQAEASAREP